MSIFETIRSANHNLFRNKVRTFLTILAIFVGSFTIILNVAINTGVNSFIDDQIESLGGKDYIMIVPKSSINSMSSMMQSSNDPVEYDPEAKIEAFSEADLDKLGKIDGLDRKDFHIPKNYQVEYITSGYTKKKYNVQLGVLPPGNFNIPMTAGELPDRNSDEYLIALEPGYSKALGFKSDEDAINKSVSIMIKDPLTDELTSFTARVVGVQAPGVVAINGSIISSALDEAMYETFMKHYPPQVSENTAYAVQTRFDNTKYTEAEIKEALEDNGFYGMTVSDMMGTIRTFFDVIMIVFSIFGGIALIAAAIGIVNTLLMSVEERTREIGLDKALGMSSGKIFLNFSTEAIVLGFWGSAFGIAVAMVVGYFVNQIVHAPGGFLEEFPTFSLFEFTPWNVIPIVLIIMFIAFIAGTAPALKAARKNPIDALRYE